MKLDYAVVMAAAIVLVASLIVMPFLPPGETGDPVGAQVVVVFSLLAYGGARFL